MKTQAVETKLDGTEVSCLDMMHHLASMELIKHKILKYYTRVEVLIFQLLLHVSVGNNHYQNSHPEI